MNKTPTYYVGKPNVTDKNLYLSRVSSILDSSILTNNGTFVQQLETEFAKYHGTSYAVAFANASLALEMVLSTIPPGEVILPTFTFIATAQAVRRAGHKLIFVDVNQDNFGMNIKQLEDKITRATKAIVPVNLFGDVCNTREISDFGVWHGIPVVYDSAHGTGMKALGFNGTCEVFSLHATKICNSIEGGMVTTNNLELVKKLRAIRNFGYASGDGLPPEGIFHSPYLATNCKMSEMHAAMGLTNFEQIDKLKTHYREVFNEYMENLQPGVNMHMPASGSNYSYIPILVDNQKELTNHLRGLNIFVRNYFNYLCSDVMSKFEQFPIARSLVNRIVHLPTGLDINKEDVKYISQVINAFQQKG
jgi:dTDP-4-amino-4,6-dideoxygalactose transaminase